MFNILSNIIAIIILSIGSYTDIKTREVPDWLNFSLIALGFSLSILASLIFNTWDYIIYAVAGFLLCLIISLLMFYTGQWGGGDSKMIMGLGALIGLNIFNVEYVNFSLISFLINILFIGAFYGLLWSIILSIKNRKLFIKETKKIISNHHFLNYFLIILFLLNFILIFYVKNMMLKIIPFFILMFILLIYMYYYIKIVEKVCMIKYVLPSQLTEGDWIAKDIKVNNKIIASPKDLGISIKQINKLKRLYKKNKVKKILIKEGIPFVPSFLIAFIITLLFGNLIFLFLI